MHRKWENPMATTKATKKTKTSPKAGAVKVTEAPDCAASAGCESQTAQDDYLPGYPFDRDGRPIARKGTSEPVSVTPVYHTDPEIIRRLDRIVELLEGTLKVDRKGLSLDSPFWNKMLDPDR